MKFTALALSLLLTACGAGHPVSKHVSNAQLIADKNECNFEAIKATPSLDMGGFERAQVYNACLSSKGYH